jgi:hypothetical protein
MRIVAELSSCPGLKSRVFPQPARANAEGPGLRHARYRFGSQPPSPLNRLTMRRTAS